MWKLQLSYDFYYDPALFLYFKINDHYYYLVNTGMHRSVYDNLNTNPSAVKL